MKRLPFRRRITVWSTLVAAVALAVCAVVAAFFVHRREVAEIDAALRDESNHFFGELERHGGAKFDWRKVEGEMREWMLPRNPPWFMEVRTGTDVRWRSPNLAAPGFIAEPPGIRDVHPRGNALRLLVTEHGGVTFAIAAGFGEADGMVRDVVFAMLAGLPFALAFAWLGGRWVASLAVAPIEEMTAAAERVTAERLDQRVPVPPVRDEIQDHARVLNATLDRLERSYQQALRFSADASHELKTPLTVMRAGIEAVLDSPSLGEDVRAAIASLLEQTRRLSNITASLLLLARADAGRLTLDLSEKDIAVITEACAEDARIVAERSGVTVECTLPEHASARVDALRFAQITSNLLDNAVKYNVPGGRVRVNLADDGAIWRIVIGNSGPVIKPEHRPQLFERFFRADHTAERPGQGLGLSLARELARAHGGDVALVRSEDGWTEFAATIPKSGSNGAH
jgi:two-component system, OmpR family, heavy metal sensor histidine kinase CusS